MPLPADGGNLKLGKGSLLLDQFLNGVAQGFDFAGNVTAMTLSAETTTAELYSSTQQGAPLIARATTQVAYTLTATLSEYTFEMLRKFLLAENNTTQQAANAAAAVTLTGVTLGRYYQLNARQVSNVSVFVGSNEMTLNQDYQVNSEFGLIRPLAGGAINENDDVIVNWQQSLLTINQLRIAKIASPIVHLVYLSDDANPDGAGAKDRLEIWRANVAPEGELNLIGDEYGSYQLSMAVLDDSANHPNDPFGNYERIAA